MKYEHSILTKESIRESLRLYWASDRAKARKSRQSKPLTEEHRQKIAESMRQHYITDEGQQHRENLSKKMKKYWANQNVWTDGPKE